MKIVATIAIAFLSLNPLSAQDGDIYDKMSQYVCDCTNGVLSFLDEDVKDAVMNMEKMSEEEGNAYIESLDQDLYQRLVTQSVQLSDGEIATGIETCLTKYDSSLSEEELTEIEEATATDEKSNQFMNEIIERMNVEDCAFVKMLLILGSDY